MTKLSPGIFIGLCLVTLASCEHATKPINASNPLVGVWLETFQWSQLQVGPYQRTSTIEFSEQEFRVKILPPHREIKVTGDSFYVGFSADTLYAGTYLISDHGITFQVKVPGAFTERMAYAIKNDSLFLSPILGSADDSGAKYYPFESFLWAGSFGKTSGIFTKTGAGN
ncbi:hypothetical protein L0337_40515 [candidate division KSB1 bacterium]|nr:hypothetical protein [candidate division KSB1 bacterium]